MFRKPKDSKPIKAEEVETFVEWLVSKAKEHFRWFFFGLGTAFVAGALLWGYSKYNSDVEEKVAYAYYMVTKEMPDENKSLENWEKISSDFIKLYGHHQISLLAKIEKMRVNLQAKKWDAIIKEGETLVKEVGDSHSLKPFILRYLAVAYVEDGKIEEAFKTFESLLNIAPEAWKREIYWKMGLIYKAQGKMVEAKGAFSKALEATGIFPTRELIQEEINSRELAEKQSSS